MKGKITFNIKAVLAIVCTRRRSLKLWFRILALILITALKQYLTKITLKIILLNYVMMKKNREL